VLRSSFGEVRFEAVCDPGGSFRDAAPNEFASVEEVPYSEPRKLIISLPQHGGPLVHVVARLSPSDWPMFEAKRDSIDWLEYNGRRRKAYLGSVVRRGSPSNSELIEVGAEFVQVPPNIPMD
jgi:hypothetical protein